MIFLVITLGALHGVILLPVLLSLFGPGSCTKESTTKVKVRIAQSGFFSFYFHTIDPIDKSDDTVSELSALSAKLVQF